MRGCGCVIGGIDVKTGTRVCLTDASFPSSGEDADSLIRLRKKIGDRDAPSGRNQDGHSQPSVPVVLTSKSLLGDGEKRAYDASARRDVPTIDRRPVEAAVRGRQMGVFPTSLRGVATLIGNARGAQHGIHGSQVEGSRS